MVRKVSFAASAGLIVAAVSLLLNASGRSVQADEPKGQKLEAVQKAIADSKLPGEIKKMTASGIAPTFGKVYYVWPMSNGTFLFGISTPMGGSAFTIKTGDLTADAMIKVILMAYEKQTPLYVFEDAGKPQVAAGVVSVTP